MRVGRTMWLLAAYLLISAGSSAMWGHIPLRNLLLESDIIVIGTLQDVREYSENGVDYGEGTILVHDTIWGELETDRRLELRWHNPSALACPRVEHYYYRDKRTIWLLTQHEDGTVRADYPGRHLSVDRRGEVEHIMGSNPVRVAAGEPLEPDSKHPIVELGYRNTSDTTRVFPGIEYAAGCLTLGSRDVVLRFYEGALASKAEAQPREGAIVVDEGLPPMVVAARTDVGVVVDLATLFDYGTPHPGVCTIYFGVIGLGEAHEFVHVVR